MSLYAVASPMTMKNRRTRGANGLFDAPGPMPYVKQSMGPMEIDSFNNLQSVPSLMADSQEEEKPWQHLYVLPVLLFEFLALALTRAVMPALLLERFDQKVYLVMGIVDCVRGMLAFISCPIFGKFSDIVGRRLCLFVTVAGTCMPVCAVALMEWVPAESKQADMGNITSSASTLPEEEVNVFSSVLEGSTQSTLTDTAVTVFVVLLSLSGIFSSTFTLVFAYISDTVKNREERVSAYGLALATFGLSFTIGPMAGGYLAQYNTRYVFVSSLLFTVLDLIYIYAVLPESLQSLDTNKSVLSVVTEDIDHSVSWNPIETLRVISIDPFLRRVGQIAFFYYTSLWAMISTLVIYAAKRFELGPERLGELMSALGLSTMVAEAVLVRIIVPILGEKQSMRIGLAAFIFQCIALGLAYDPWHLFICILFSMVSNLVYPSLSSLVSGNVEPEAVGEALGAINGVKALTEGIGPLFFGGLLTLSENSALPGWPYLLAAFIVYFAYALSRDLPDPQKDEYVHEMERKKKRSEATRMLDRFVWQQRRRKGLDELGYYEDEDDEYAGLLENDIDAEDKIEMSSLSEIEEEEYDNRELSKLPTTFASLRTGKR